MKLFKKLAGDSFWILIARVGAQVCMAIVTYLLARRLGAAGFGQYAFLATVVVIGNVFTTFGSDMVLIRRIAEENDLSDVPSVLSLQLLLSSLFIGTVLLFADSLPNQTPESILALKVYSFALIPLAFFTVFTSILRGVQKMTSYASLNFIMGVVQVVVIFIFAHHGLNIVNLAYLLLGIQTTGAALAGLFCMVAIPYFWKNLHFSTHKFYSISRACLPVAMIAILGILHQKTSLTMLSFMGSASMAGVFSAAARVVEAAQIGHFVILTALYPVLANAHRDRTIRSTFRFSWILFLAVSTGASVLLFLLARPIVDLFFVRQYQPSIVVLRILAFTLIPYTVNSFLSTFLLAQKQERVILRVLGVSLFMLLVLNFILIPMNGQIGASWATLVAAIAQSMLFVWAWMGNPLRRMDSPPLKGTSYELSDLS